MTYKDSLDLLREGEIVGRSKELLRKEAAECADSTYLRLSAENAADETIRAELLLNAIYGYQIALNAEAVADLWKELFAMSDARDPAVSEVIGIVAILLGPETARQVLHLPIPSEGVRRAVAGLAASDRAELEAAYTWFFKNYRHREGMEAWHPVLLHRIDKALEPGRKKIPASKQTFSELLSDLREVSPEMHAVARPGSSLGLFWELEIVGASDRILSELAKAWIDAYEARHDGAPDDGQTIRAASRLIRVYCHQIAGNPQLAMECFEELVAMKDATHPAVFRDIALAAIFLGPKAAQRALNVRAPEEEGLRHAVKAIAEWDRAGLEMACAWFDARPLHIEQGVNSWLRIVRFRLAKFLEAMGVGGASQHWQPRPRRIIRNRSRM
jgi:hypothetical protein